MTTNNPADIVAFLNARYDEREAIALAAARYGGTWPTGSGDTVTPELAHARANDPATVLADLESKRLILGTHSHPHCDWCADGGKEGEDGEPCRHLALLALPFDTHPDYRQEWKP